MRKFQLCIYMELNTVEFVIELGNLINLIINELLLLLGLAGYAYLHNYFASGDHPASSAISSAVFDSVRRDSHFPVYFNLYIMCFATINCHAPPYTLLFYSYRINHSNFILIHSKCTSLVEAYYSSNSPRAKRYNTNWTHPLTQPFSVT